MPSLLTTAEKTTYGSVFNDIHDTFSREIRFWKTPKRVVLSTDTEYNFLYDDQESISYNTIVESGVFNGRILWGDPSKAFMNPNFREEISENTCRVKVRSDSMHVFNSVEQIEIDGKNVQKINSERPHGLFEIDYYTIYFKEVN
jgi:hypothetical protein